MVFRPTHLVTPSSTKYRTARLQRFLRFQANLRNYGFGAASLSTIPQEFPLSSVVVVGARSTLLPPMGVDINRPVSQPSKVSEFPRLAPVRINRKNAGRRTDFHGACATKKKGFLLRVCGGPICPRWMEVRHVLVTTKRGRQAVLFKEKS